MKTLALAIATTALTATVASAGVTIDQIDTNGDRFATVAEVSSVLPTITASDFRELDTNRDRRLSSNEVQAAGAQAILRKHVAAESTVLGLSELDVNGDRFASFSEIAAAYPGFRATDFDDIDVNDDGRVSANELYASTAQEVVTRYEDGSSILVSLDELDTDGSGFASYGELAARYPNLSNVDFNRFDSNKDNRISFDELYRLDAIEVLGENR